MLEGLMSKWRMRWSQPWCRYSIPRAIPVAISSILLAVINDDCSWEEQRIYFSSDALGMNSYTRARLDLSEQNPRSRTTLAWWMVPMVATSLMNSSSPVESSSILTATGTGTPPFGSSPLYTLPNPPCPSLLLNRLVIFLTSENVYLLGFSVL
ncbi:hypothetical protein Zm00014a_014600 [Zea mays]|uniref:Uncharacterized protein n=1 Tax=Zea mays TaxID=4577 RepID=A0A3L6DID5_MAIZE|nr:hypothetical protein Zm00014a_014600 [Zea mays]